MKKHLLLILALLAFVLPARAASLLINFVGNDDNRTSNTKITAGMNLNQVFTGFVGDEVTYPLVISNYVSSITAANNAYYNDINSMRLGANGSLTFKLAKKYKVTGYDIRGYKKTDVARVTINGHTVDGPTVTTNSGQQSNVPVQLSATEETDQIAISTDKEVYIKGICIYYETDASELTVNVAPAPGTYNVGQVIMAMANNSSAAIKFFVDKKSSDGSYSENVLDQDETGSASYTFSEPGDYRVTAQAHYGGYGNWANSSEQFIGYYTIEGDEPTPATLSVDLKTGSYKLPQTVTVTSSKTDDDIIVILTDENDQEVVNGTFKGSWNRTFTTPGTFALEALNDDGATISEIYELGYAPEAPVFSKANGAYTNGTEVTISSKYATKLAVKIIKKTDYDANGFNATGTQTIYDADSHTLNLTEDVVIVAQGKNDFGTTSTDYRIYTISNPVKPNVAPVISFSHEDQNVFGSEVEIDVTLSLNPDVYPVPEVIYYTLDGFMAHNTLETGKPGATPAGHVLTVAVDPATLSGTVRIERSHREALNHRAVTINAYTFNTAGSDVAAATYIFNDNGSAQTAQYVAPPKTATGDPITITPSQINNAGKIGDNSSSTVNGYTFTFAKSSSQYTPKLNGSYIQFYANNTMTISSATNFEKIELTCTSGYAKSTKASTGNVSVANNVITWTGDTNTVTLTNSATGQSRITSIKIYPASTPVADAVATPVITGADEGAVYTEDVTVTVSCETEGASITLTDNGTAVTLNNGQYTITGFTKHTLVAKATKEGMSDSKEATLSFTIKDPNAPTIQYVKATEVKEGDEIIILSKTSSNVWYVMQTSTSGNPPAIAAPTGFDGQIIDDDDSYQKLTVVKEGDNFYLMNGTKYLYNNGSKSDLNANSTTKAAIVFFPTDGNNISDIQVGSRYVRMYSSKDFRAYANNNTGTYAYIFKKYTPTTPTVATPEIALNDRAGDTTKPVTATISCSTDGADVHYSVKKNDVETVADELYSTALTFNEAGIYELTAWATKEGMTASAKASESFTITVPVCQAPAFEPLSGAEAFNSLTVKLSCATEGAQIQYKVNNGEQKAYDANTGIVLEGVGVYTITAWATKEGMTKSAEVTATYTVKAEPVEELFFVMDQNLWDVDGAYPETVVPFVYDRENGWYDLDIASIPATGWRQTAEGWFEINGGFRGNFYVRDGKANRKGLVFGAAGTVANTTYATRAAADGNQLVEPGVEYNMYIAGEGDTHKVFTTIGDDTNSKAFSAGTIRVTHTPGNKDAAKPMTLQILANSDQTTGVDSITAEDAANDADARFFNLQGVEVPADRLAPGIYIRQAGSKATKVLVK